jgi:hypothetical protein
MGKLNMKPIGLAALALLAAGTLAGPTWAQTKHLNNHRHVHVVEQHRVSVQTPHVNQVTPSAAKQPEYPPDFGWDVSY